MRMDGSFQLFVHFSWSHDWRLKDLKRTQSKTCGDNGGESLRDGSDSQGNSDLEVVYSSLREKLLLAQFLVKLLVDLNSRVC